jgi:tRNA dimethylallyltransferase
MMFEKGLEREVRDLLDMGVPSGCTAMQAIGYKEILQARFGEISMAKAAEKIKQESRRLAKRQLTWHRNDNSVQWIERDKIKDREIIEELIVTYET